MDHNLNQNSQGSQFIRTRVASAPVVEAMRYRGPAPSTGAEKASDSNRPPAVPSGFRLFMGPELPDLKAEAERMLKLVRAIPQGQS